MSDPANFMFNRDKVPQAQIDQLVALRKQRRQVLKTIGGNAGAIRLANLGSTFVDISSMFNTTTESYSNDDLGALPSISESDITNATQLLGYGIEVGSILYDEALATNAGASGPTVDNDGSIGPNGAKNSITALSDDRSKVYKQFWDWGLALGSPAVNPIGIPHQFGVLDDVRNPYLSNDPLEPFSDKSNDRIGRVYGDYIKKNQRVVQFQMGVQVNNTSVLDWLGGSDAEANQKYLRGDGGPLAGLGKAALSIKGVIGDAFTALTNGLFTKKAVDFRERMDVYFDYVNELLFELAASMGLTSGDPTQDRFGTSELGTTPSIKGEVSSPWHSFEYVGGHPIINNRLDIRQFLGENHTGGFGGDKPGKWGWVDAVGDFIGGAASKRLRYIPFMITKNVQVSETWSNSTEEHPLMSSINEAAQQSYENDAGAGASNALADPVSAAQNFFTNKAKKVIISKMGEMAAIQSGIGRYSLPEIWSGSRFERSYSLTFKFYSPYGDKISIFENVLLPTMCLIAMTAPQKIDKDSYTSPFVIRAYSPGLFACNFGMVTSLSLTKGDDKNEKTIDGLSKVMTATLSIKDLIPDFMLSMSKGNFYHASNTQLMDFMWIMSGQSLSEKDYIWRNTNFFLMRMQRMINDFTSGDAWVSALTSMPIIHGTLGFAARFFPYSNLFEETHQLRSNSLSPLNPTSPQMNVTPY